ncbi:MAG: Fur family transcriptional regulator [Balneolales bacterium]
MLNLEQFLRKYGLKATRNRIEILSILRDSDTALSHNDITERLGDTYIDKVTLYRTLNAFTEKNIIHKVASEDRNWKYALYIDDHKKPEVSHEHAHFVCNQCDQIYCFPMEPITKPDLTTSTGFVVDTREVRLHGLCPTCQI